MKEEQGLPQGSLSEAGLTRQTEAGRARSGTVRSQRILSGLGWLECRAGGGEEVKGMVASSNYIDLISLLDIAIILIH